MSPASPPPSLWAVMRSACSLALLSPLRCDPPETAHGTRMCRRGGAPIRSAPARHGPGPLRSQLPSLARPEVTGGDPAAHGRPGVPSTWPGPLLRPALAQRSAPSQGFRLGGLGVALLFYLGGHWVHWPTGCSLSRRQRNRWRCKESGASVARSANRLQLGVAVTLNQKSEVDRLDLAQSDGHLFVHPLRAQVSAPRRFTNDHLIQCLQPSHRLPLRISG